MTLRSRGRRLASAGIRRPPLSAEQKSAYAAHMATIPDPVPKHWLTVCDECLFTFVQSFRVKDCPVCNPVKP